MSTLGNKSFFQLRFLTNLPVNTGRNQLYYSKQPKILAADINAIHYASAPRPLFCYGPEQILWTRRSRTSTCASNNSLNVLCKVCHGVNQQSGWNAIGFGFGIGEKWGASLLRAWCCRCRTSNFATHHPLKSYFTKLGWGKWAKTPPPSSEHPPPLLL